MKECHVFLDHENLYAIPRYLATAVNKLHSNHADNCGGVAAPKTSKHQISFPSRTYNLIGIKCYLFVFEPIKLKTANISCENQHFQHKNQPTYASIRFRNQLVEQLLKIICHIVGKGQAALSFTPLKKGTSAWNPNPFTLHNNSDRVPKQRVQLLVSNMMHSF